ncbi:MAG: hypothetical protein MRQ09_03960 [Candidatus Midichloria sp.]|nr:hypothetical protein [Candidatus Midichloria sp.]
MLKKALRNLIINITVAIKRFPLPVLFSVFFCVISIGKFAAPKLKATYLTILFCGGFWLIALKLFAESKSWRSAYYNMVVETAIFLIMAWHLYTAPEALIPFSFLGPGLFPKYFYSIWDITLDNNTGIKLAVKLEPSTNLYVVQINTNESVTFELEDLIGKLNTTTNNANSIENFIMEKESPTLTIRLMLKHVSGIFEKDSNKPTISSIDTIFC